MAYIDPYYEELHYEMNAQYDYLHELRAEHAEPHGYEEEDYRRAEHWIALLDDMEAAGGPVTSATLRVGGEVVYYAPIPVSTDDIPF